MEDRPDLSKALDEAYNLDCVDEWDLEEIARRGENLVRATVEATEPHTRLVLLNVTEYEASILSGALLSFDPPGYAGDGSTAITLQDRVQDQLPAEWKE